MVQHVQKKMGRTYVPLLKSHPVFFYVKARVNRTYNEMLRAMSFDKEVAYLLSFHVTEKREEYSRYHFSPDVLREINQLNNKPRILTPPLYWHEKQVYSMVETPFWGRLRADSFGHTTISCRRKGEELFFSLRSKKKDDYYPVLARPFLSEYSREILDAQFKPYGKTFVQAFSAFKGLYSIWYDFDFNYRSY